MTAGSSPTLVVVLSTDRFDQVNSRWAGKRAITRVKPGEAKTPRSTRGVLVVETIKYFASYETPEAEVTALQAFAAAQDVVGTESWSVVGTDDSPSMERQFFRPNGDTVGFRISVAAPAAIAMTIEDHAVAQVGEARAQDARVERLAVEKAARDTQLTELKTLLGVPADDTSTIRTYDSTRVTVSVAAVLDYLNAAHHAKERA